MTTPGLEVDSRQAQGGKMTDASGSEEKIGVSKWKAWYPVAQGAAYGPSPSYSPAQDKRRAGLSRAVFFLSLALALAVVALAVVAGVVGSIAAKRQNDLKR